MLVVAASCGVPRCAHLPSAIQVDIMAAALLAVNSAGWQFACSHAPTISNRFYIDIGDGHAN